MSPNRIRARHRTSPALLAALALTAVCLLLLAPDALAASGQQVGKNIGDLLKQWGGEIYGGIIAVVALIFLLNRRYNELALFVIAAIVVGWFVLSPDQVASAARGIGQKILGG